MLRKVSCWPAKDASGRSSAVALERTATDTPSSPPVNSRYAWEISASICFGKDVASIQPRMSAPQRASASTSSASSPFRRASMRVFSPPWPMNSR